MLKYRKLNGVETLKEGDEFLNYDCETWLSVTETMIGKMLNQTEIVVARRIIEQEKPFTAVNWLNHNPPEHSCSNNGNLRNYWSESQIIQSFNSGRKIGRLEEYQRKEQVDLRKAAQDFVWSSCGTTKLKNALEDLKQPEEK